MEGSRTVLLVEDEAVIAMSEAAALRKEGYEVIQAYSGEEAIVKIVSVPGGVDLVLMDINLGAGIDGVETAQAILKDHDLPIIFLTSHTEKEIIEKAEQITSYGYVVKDTGFRVLATSVKMAFKLYAANQRIQAKNKEIEAVNQELRKSEKRFHNIFDKSPLGAALSDSVTGRFLEVNPRYLEIVGLTRDELLKTDFQSITHPDDLQEDLDNMRRLMAGEINGFGMEKRYIRPDGSVVWVNLTVVPMWEENEPHNRHLVMAEDITERERVMEALRASEERLRTVTENAPDTILQVDHQGIIQYINRPVPGLTREQVIGSSVYEWIPKEQYPVLNRALQAAFTTGRYQEYVSLGPGPYGEARTYNVRVMPVLAGGQADSAVYIATDITERKQADGALRQQAHVLESISEAVIISDPNFIVQSWNRAAEETYGWTAQEVIGKSARDVLRAEFQEPVEQVIGLFFASGRWKGEAIHHRKDGTPIHILGSMSLIKDEQGQPVAVVSANRDITTRKQAEDMLQKKSDEAEKFFSSALDLLCIADTNGYFRRLNREWEKVLGYRLEELEGRRFLDLVHPDDVAATLAAIGELEANKQVLNFTNRYRCKDGSYRWIEWRSVPSDTDIYAAARDITERKRVQEALEQSLREKELLMKELQHRVKNSLSVVASLIDLERWNLTDQHARQVFANTKARILSMSAIYGQLYQTGAVDSVDLQTYIQSLADALSVSYMPAGGRVRIVTRLSEVQLDLKRSLPLGLILNELITNALKYAYPSGTAGDIRIELEHTGGQVILRVSDDGIGMPDLQQGSADSGLGLKLVDMLVQQIDGSFTIDGRKGTSVSIAFETQ